MHGRQGLFQQDQPCLLRDCSRMDLDGVPPQGRLRGGSGETTKGPPYTQPNPLACIFLSFYWNIPRPALLFQNCVTQSPLRGKIPGIMSLEPSRTFRRPCRDLAGRVVCLCLVLASPRTTLFSLPHLGPPGSLRAS